MIDILKKAGPDPTKWKKGDSPEGWANIFFMNAAQHAFALIPLRTRGLVELLEPLLKINHYQSLKASATIAYLVGGDAEGDKLELLKSATSSIDRIIDLLSNTLNLKGGQGYGGYGYGVFPLSSSVRAISVLATNDDHKSYLLASDKAVITLLVRVLREFVSDTGGGSAGGGGKDKLSAELAASALLEFSYQSSTYNNNNNSKLDPTSSHILSLFAPHTSLKDLLTNFHSHSSTSLLARLDSAESAKRIATHEIKVTKLVRRSQVTDVIQKSADLSLENAQKELAEELEKKTKLLQTQAAEHLALHSTSQRVILPPRIGPKLPQGRHPFLNSLLPYYFPTTYPSPFNRLPPPQDSRRERSLPILPPLAWNILNTQWCR
jgi:hypothetical protein